MDKEIRSFDFEMRAEQKEDGKGEIFGRPIVYEQKTDLGGFDEVIASGALDRANLKDVRLLVNHDTSMIPLARSRNNNAAERSAVKECIFHYSYYIGRNTDAFYCAV